ncbi:amino acid transporter [Penicillium malachiteum]|uniref:amino acid transporter n=1 Tax=Penicillium malachiteum TaxID=1324776 RepID=UPI002546C0C5|nr:amino acid transporter [Penicillium malachiteum]KAJ5730283.1 amino acid transporter [Penicillium malachiteum]
MKMCTPAGDQLEIPLRVGEENSFHNQDRVALSNKDAYELARVGKKEVLKVWALENTKRPAGLVYGFIAVWMAFISIFIALGELASMIPSVRLVDNTTGLVYLLPSLRPAFSATLLALFALLHGLRAQQEPSIQLEAFFRAHLQSTIQITSQKGGM